MALSVSETRDADVQGRKSRLNDTGINCHNVGGLLHLNAERNASLQISLYSEAVLWHDQEILSQGKGGLPSSRARLIGYGEREGLVSP